MKTNTKIPIDNVLKMFLVVCGLLLIAFLIYVISAKYNKKTDTSSSSAPPSSKKSSSSTKTSSTTDNSSSSSTDNSSSSSTDNSSSSTTDNSSNITEKFNIDNDVYKINNDMVLSPSELGQGVLKSYLTSVGTLSSLTVDSPITGYTSKVIPAEGQIGYIKSGTHTGTSTSIPSNTILNIMSIELTTGTYLLQGWFVPEARGTSNTKSTLTSLMIGIQESASTLNLTNNNNVVISPTPGLSFQLWMAHSYDEQTVSISTTVNVQDTKTFYFNIYTTIVSETGASATCRGSKFYATRIA